ncbi:hypothetical protein [Micromonospora okii]|uniref:hypothetical protein n=1 Tax=Micromonospora okii TaxID=1182970 RepID=UPI001E31029B|nr:hypothetical protein [Micromonospora okii]
MGEQAVTGVGATPLPEGAPISGGATTAGMTADGAPAAPADVSGAGMSADAGTGTSRDAGTSADAGGTSAAPPAGEPAPPAGEPAPAAPAGGEARSRTADIVPGPGGVMTDEVGVVTGELTLRTEYADGRVTLRVQYREADEWYVVTGGSAPLADPAGLDAVHAIAVGLLDRPEG